MYVLSKAIFCSIFSSNHFITYDNKNGGETVLSERNFAFFLKKSSPIFNIDVLH